MHILLAPSEGKSFEGNLPPLNKNSLLFANAYDTRLEILNAYQALIDNEDFDALHKLFGFKDLHDVYPYSSALFGTPTQKAIRRYVGVAYDYIDYDTLDAQQQAYIDTHVMIFSNLFGPLRASDTIPLYRIKQGNNLKGINIAAYYKKHFTPLLDDYLHSDEVLDLRAGYYDKFYTIKKPHHTVKFLKNNKVVSHWAKAYRGILTRLSAQHSVNNVEALMRVLPPELRVKERTASKHITQWIIDIK